MTPSVTRQCSSPRLHSLKCRTCRLFMLVTFAKSLTYISRLLSHNMFVIISHCATCCEVAHHSTLRGLRSVSIAAKRAGVAVTRLFPRTRQGGGMGVLPFTLHISRVQILRPPGSFPSQNAHDDPSSALMLSVIGRLPA